MLQQVLRRRAISFEGLLVPWDHHYPILKSPRHSLEIEHEQAIVRQESSLLGADATMPGISSKLQLQRHPGEPVSKAAMHLRLLVDEMNERDACLVL